MARPWVLRRDAPVPDGLGPMPPGGPLGALLTQLLWSRGIASAADADAFLEPTLARGLRPPSMLPGLEWAAARVAEAIALERGVRIDAEASVAALAAAAALRGGLDVSADHAAVSIGVGTDRLELDGVALDGGPLGLDVGGLGFYLLIAVRRALRDLGRPDVRDPRAQLDLVALSSLAAGTTLRDEQRVLVALGLRRMDERLRPGLAALAESAFVGRATARAVVTRIVPRLAAAVASDDGARVLSVLLAPTHDVAAADAAAIELAAARQRTEAPPTSTSDESIVVDAEWSLAEATPRLLLALGRLEPHGAGNPEPVLVARGARLDGARLAGDPTRPYWRLRLRQDSHTVRAVAQQMRTSEIVVGRLYDVAYTPRVGHVRGGGPIEIAVHDLHEHTPLATGHVGETAG